MKSCPSKGLKKIISYCLVLLILLLNPLLLLAKSLEVTGSATIYSGNTGSAKNQALKNALRQAVEQGVGHGLHDLQCPGVDPQQLGVGGLPQGAVRRPSCRGELLVDLGAGAVGVRGLPGPLTNDPARVDVELDQERPERLIGAAAGLHAHRHPQAHGQSRP